MTPIEKASFEATMREIRKLYRRHAAGEINASTFTEQSGRLFKQLKIHHIQSMVTTTAEAAETELRSYEKQFGLELQLESRLFYERGLKAEIEISVGGVIYGGIYIGPRFDWSQLAVGEGNRYYGPNLYTKKMAKRWKNVDDFDFSSYLGKLKQRIEDSEAEKQKQDERKAQGLPRHEDDEIPF